MSTCDVEKLEAIVDGTAESDEHVASCVACRAELAALRRERALFADRPEEPTAALWKNVEERIMNTTPKKHVPAALWIGGALAASAVVVLVRATGVAPHAIDVKPTMPGAMAPTHATTFDKKLAVNGRPQLKVEALAGKVVFVEGNDEVFHVSTRYDASFEEHWTIDARDDVDRAVIRVHCKEARCSDAPELKLRIEVPKKSKLDITTASADVVFGELDVDAKIATASGDILLKQVGNLDATTVSGDVDVTCESEQCDVRTTSGDIKLESSDVKRSRITSASGDIDWQGGCEKACTLDLETTSGDIEMLLKDDSYAARYETTSGEVGIDVGWQKTESPARTGKILAGTGAMQMTVKSVSGSLQLNFAGVPDETPDRQALQLRRTLMQAASDRANDRAAQRHKKDDDLVNPFESGTPKALPSKDHGSLMDPF